MQRRTFDTPFLVIVIILVLAGFFIFTSASLGLLARDGAQFSAIAFNQLLGLIIGGIILVITSRINYKNWNKFSLFIFIASIAATLLVFVPGLGFAHGGAQRWILIGSFSFQPSELLKLGLIIYWAAWMAGGKVNTVRYGVVPLIVLLAIVGGILGFQPDIGTFLVISITAFVMYVAAGGKWTHIFSMGIVAVAILIALGFSVPYLNERLTTFINPARDPLGAGYQIQQSLIAIGSGEIFGRGFGQSIQKFRFLPEPIGDSIFAVFAEEWGFVGAVALILLFLAFAIRGFTIAGRAPTVFTRLTVVGIITLITVQSFINIASMLGAFPLTGMPLFFVSQGGSALIAALAMVGIVLNISKYQRS